METSVLLKLLSCIGIRNPQPGDFARFQKICGLQRLKKSHLMMLWLVLPSVKNALEYILNPEDIQHNEHEE